MSKKDEALKLALEALELNNDEWKSLADSGDSGYWKAEDQDHYQQTNKAIAALREALAEQPAQRTWVGLTDEEVSKIIDDEIGFNSCWGPEEQFARSIEAKLREKNT